MNPTPDQVASIRSFVAGLAGGWANTDAQVRAAMAAATIANPTPRATVPVPYTPAGLMGLLSPPSLANLYLYPAVHDLFVSVLAQDAAGVLASAALLHSAGKITDAEAAAVQAAVAATEPDPSWPATVPWDVAHLGRPCDDYDIEAARRG